MSNRPPRIVLATVLVALLVGSAAAALFSLGPAGRATGPAATARAVAASPGVASTQATDAIGGVAEPTIAPPTVPKAPVDSRLVIVRAKPGADVSALVGTVKPEHGDYVLQVPAGKTTASYTAELAGTGAFEYATTNQVAYPLDYIANPNDPDFKSAASFGGIAHWKSWWERGTGSPNFDQVWQYLKPDGNAFAYDARVTSGTVKVAVIDTGFYMNHPDGPVAGANIAAGKDEFQTYTYATNTFTRDGTVTPAPNSDATYASHGTMVASEIAQSTNNGTGGAGAAYDTQVRIYKVAGVMVDEDPVDGIPAGSVVMLDSAVDTAIYDATNDGCKVINMSLGGYSADNTNPPEQAAIDYAYSHGVVVVAAVGNDDTSTPMFPAACKHVIGVGSCRLSNGTNPIRSSFSNRGTSLDLLAPGESVWGPLDPTANLGYGLGYYSWDGTSMASPLVAAAAALTLRFMPSLGPDDVESTLEGSAVHMGGQSGYDTTNGAGRLDMAAAYAKLKHDYPNLANPAISGIPASGIVVSPNVTLAWLAVAGFNVTYGVSVDGAAPTTSAATTRSLAGLPDGQHRVTVTPVSPRNWNAGSAAAVTFTVRTVPLPVTTPLAPIAPYYADSVTISLTATPGLHGAAVAATYCRIDTGPQTESSTAIVVGAGTHSVTYWSVDASGNAEPPHTVTFTIVVPPSTKGTPSTPAPVATLKHGKSFTTFGYVVRHTARTHPVTLQFYRYQSRHWVLRTSITAVASNILTFSKYSRSTSVPYSGSWRVRARHKVGKKYLHSGYRYFSAS
jgi:hypothetical protein